MNAQVRGEALRFLVVGAINTTVTYILYLALLLLFPYSISYTIAYVLGIGFAYFLNTRFVFRVQHTLARFTLFPLVYSAQYITGILALFLAVNLFKIPDRFALIASIVTTVPITFLVSRSILKPSPDSLIFDLDGSGR